MFSFCYAHSTVTFLDIFSGMHVRPCVQVATPLQFFQVSLIQFHPCHPRGGGGGRHGGSELPASRTLHSLFPPPSVAVPASVCFSYREILCQCCEILPISPFSRPFGYPASHLPPPPLPPPVDLPLPLLPGSRPLSRPPPPHRSNRDNRRQETVSVPSDGLQ